MHSQWTFPSIPLVRKAAGGATLTSFNHHHQSCHNFNSTSSENSAPKRGKEYRMAGQQKGEYNFVNYQKKDRFQLRSFTGNGNNHFPDYLSLAAREEENVSYLSCHFTQELIRAAFLLSLAIGWIFAAASNKTFFVLFFPCLQAFSQGPRCDEAGQSFLEVLLLFAVKVKAEDL